MLDGITSSRHFHILEILRFDYINLSSFKTTGVDKAVSNGCDFQEVHRFVRGRKYLQSYALTFMGEWVPSYWTKLALQNNYM